MQVVFLNINPTVQLPAVFDGETEEWSFVLPSGLEVDLHFALQFLATRRRYPTRTMPTVRSLRTYYMVEGHLQEIPWTQYLDIMATIDTQLSNLYECFCCCDTFASVVPLKDAVHGELALIQSPCDNADHHCCTACMRTILLNFYSHPVTKTSPSLTCFFPDCGSPHAHCLDDMQRIFTVEEFQQLKNHVERMQIPDTLSVPCYRCEEVIVVPMKESYKNLECIHLGCTQTGCTGASTCWNCMNKGSRCLCTTLPQSMVEQYGGAFNRFYRPLQRNFELTRETCLANIQHIIRHPKLPLAMQCPKCNAYIQKSAACNEMSHCGVKWCFCCGYQSLQNETLLMDHFGKKCPRYESRHYWREQGASNFQCIEQLCYDEYSECTCEIHRKGREEKNIVHRSQWLIQFLQSTPPKLQRWLIVWLQTHAADNLVIRRVL